MDDAIFDVRHGVTRRGCREDRDYSGCKYLATSKLTTEGGGRESNFALKNTAKRCNVTHADTFQNLFHALAAGAQQLLGLFDAFELNVFPRRDLELALELPVK